MVILHRGWDRRAVRHVRPRPCKGRVPERHTADEPVHEKQNKYKQAFIINRNHVCFLLSSSGSFLVAFTSQTFQPSSACFPPLSV